MTKQLFSPLPPFYFSSISPHFPCASQRDGAETSGSSHHPCSPLLLWVLHDNHATVPCTTRLPCSTTLRCPVGCSGLNPCQPHFVHNTNSLASEAGHSGPNHPPATALRGSCTRAMAGPGQEGGRASASKCPGSRKWRRLSITALIRRLFSYAES